MYANEFVTTRRIIENKSTSRSQFCGGGDSTASLFMLQLSCPHRQFLPPRAGMYRNQAYHPNSVTAGPFFKSVKCCDPCACLTGYKDTVSEQLSTCKLHVFRT
eukprot:983973-Pelagomonas_calceolata.AAC.1